jgi:hypothetical protein
MAKKNPGNANRTDPKTNKSLAIRNVLKRMPKAKFAEVSEAVKDEYGHDIKSSQFYMVKAKTNMKANRRVNQAKARPRKEVIAPMNTPALWVEAIKIARQLLKVTGSVDNATALLKAVNQ